MKKKIALLLVIGIIFPVLLFGQGETSNWYFGNNAGIKFNNNGTVTPLTDGRLDTFEGCTTISDAMGDLLFYTDGIIVYDRNHNIMQNGSGLFGDPSSTQSALIVPKPQDPNIFYIFTVDTTTFEGDPDYGLNYSTVDITQNNGNGAVIEKNIGLLNDCSEKIAAVVKDCSDKSIWVVTLASQYAFGLFDTYHAFEVNTSGVSLVSVQSTFPNLSIEDPRGYLKFSNDGKRMVSANMRSGLHLFDFDALNGIVSNFQQLNINGANDNAYGVEFSPNNRFLYTHSSNLVEGENNHSSSLIQFDLTANDISASQIELDSNSIYRGALQLGANGKIYRTIALNYYTGTPFLGVVNNPNEKGQAADYVHNAIALGNNGTQGLPPFIQSFFNKTDLISKSDGTSSSSTTVCEGNSFTLEADNMPGAIYNWKKDGNPISNPDNHLFHITNAEDIDSGQYSLEIILPDPNECRILGEALIEVLANPENNMLSLVQCDVDEDDMQDGITSFNLQQVKGNLNYEFLFFETISDRNQNNSIINPFDYRNTQPFNQTIYYTVINEGGCENFGELSLQVNPITFTNNNVLYACDENVNDEILSATFDLQSLAQSIYPESDVSFYSSLEDVAREQNPLPNILSTESTVVYARFENTNQCQDVLDITLVVNPTPIFEIEGIYELCADNPILNIIAPSGFDTYVWHKIDSGNLQPISNSQTVEITEIGDYQLEIGYVYNNNGESDNCTSSMEFKVIAHKNVVIENVIVQDFTSNNTVLIEVSGDGDYEYSLNGIDFADTNLFENVDPGIITVSVRDKEKCGSIEKTISVKGYSNFFTPNGDGINDHWKLIGLSKEVQANTYVRIFDRYGKKMAEFKPQGDGWDGNFKGNPLPSSDYWFQIETFDKTEIKGHFSLKR